MLFQRKMKAILFVIVIFLTGLFISNPIVVLAEKNIGKQIDIGALFDMTGPTASIGVPFAKGVEAYIKYANKQGGVKGMEVNLISIDYQYNPQKSMAAFSRLTTTENIVALIPWGSVDTPLLIPKAEEINLPLVNSAARGKAVIGKFSPVVFALAPTYTEEWVEQLYWVNRDILKKKIFNPKVAVVYNEPGRAGSKPTLENCKRLGYEVPVFEFLSSKSMSASAVMSRAKEKGCHYVMALCTLTPLTVMLKDSYKIDYHPTFFGDFFCASQLIFKMAGNSPNRTFATSPVALMDQRNVPGIQKIIKFTGTDDHMNQFVAGWVGAAVLVRGMEKANLKADMTVSQARKAIIAGLETFENEKFDGLTLPITFTKVDHIGTKEFKMFEVDWKAKKYVAVEAGY